jgi:hypothetical protein
LTLSHADLSQLSLGDDAAIVAYDYSFATFVAVCNELTALSGSPINLCT